MLVAGLARGVQQLGIERVDPGLTLDRLEQDRRGALAHGGAQGVDVIARHHPEARH